MTRSKHMEWCKKRALECKEPMAMLASMASDLGNHPETVGHPGILLAMQQKMSGGLETKAEMTEFINGFN